MAGTWTSGSMIGNRSRLVKVLRGVAFARQVPIRLALVILGVGGCCVCAVALIFGIAPRTAREAAQFHYQCDTILGPDPALTVIATSADVPRIPAPRPNDANRDRRTTISTPTKNPYASLTVPSGVSSVSPWYSACITAMRTVPLQDPPTQDVNDSFAAACAGRLALDLADESARAAAGRAALTAATASAEAMTTFVVLRASTATDIGQCGVDDERSVSTPSLNGSCHRVPGPGDPSVAVVLPSYLAEQVSCGQRVDAAWISPGDLVFWDFRHFAPLRVGIAVSRTQVVTLDPASHVVLRQPVPNTADVRVKRVLNVGD